MFNYTVIFHLKNVTIVILWLENLRTFICKPHTIAVHEFAEHTVIKKQSVGYLKLSLSFTADPQCLLHLEKFNKE